jgi:hypothetical protein
VKNVESKEGRTGKHDKHLGSDCRELCSRRHHEGLCEE